MNHSNDIINLPALANLLTQQRFHNWLFKPLNHSCHNLAKVNGIHEKVLRNFTYQFSQSTHLYGARDMNHSDQLFCMAVTLQSWLRENPHEMPKKYTAFKVPSGESFEQVLFKTYTFEKFVNWLEQVKKEINPNSYTMPYPRYLSDVMNGVSSLCKYVAARETLTQPSGMDFFDKTVKQIIEKNTVEYFTSGYPEDLLAHDKNVFANLTNQTRWTFKNDYCSTHMLDDSYKDLENTLGSNITIIDISHLNKRVA